MHWILLADEDVMLQSDVPTFTFKFDARESKLLPVMVSVCPLRPCDGDRPVTVGDTDESNV